MMLESFVYGRGLSYSYRTPEKPGRMYDTNGDPSGTENTRVRVRTMKKQK